jgi:hypothetical protein
MPWEYPEENFEVLCERCHAEESSVEYTANYCRECETPIRKDFIYCIPCQGRKFIEWDRKSREPRAALVKARHTVIHPEADPDEHDIPSDQYFGLASAEFDSAELDHDLHARAYADALGSPTRTRAIYIRVRAKRLYEADRRSVDPLARDVRELEVPRKISSAASAPAQTDADFHRVVSPEEEPRAATNPTDENGARASVEFSDPAVAEAVRVMRSALEASRGIRRS